MSAAVAVLIWFVAMFLLAYRFHKKWKHFGDIASFLVYVVGLVFLVFLLF
jgi:membrane protein DedA with SNARE-associated domain